MSADLLDRLDAWKTRYGQGGAGRLERLLSRTARRRFGDPGSVIRLHETLLFLRAYPHSAEVARLADSILLSFSRRVLDSPAFEEPPVSGIAGTSLAPIFSYEVARRLAARHPRAIEIAWDRYANPDVLGHCLSRAIPPLREEWPVEAHVSFRDWLRAAKPRGQSDLGWLLDRTGPEVYDALQVPLVWDLGNSRAARTHTRLPAKRLFPHDAPLVRRGDVSLARELEGPPLPIERLSRARAEKVLDLILDTSAVRYRELHGFTHPDAGRVWRARAGRGVEMVFFGVPPAWRLPLRAYHAAMFFKNGVPSGYVEVLSLFERAEVGFNLYYTFREGESAWIYARLLRLFRQTLGVNTFSVDPYQIGHENEEAIDSGAFWFYRKLGFRPVEPAMARLVAREEERMRARPGYRTPPRTLRRLAEGYLLYEGPGAEPGAWDRFRMHNLGLAATRRGVDSAFRLVPAGDLEGLDAVLRAKAGPDESRYLRLIERRPGLRSAFLKLGSSPIRPI